MIFRHADNPNIVFDVRDILSAEAIVDERGRGLRIYPRGLRDAPAHIPHFFDYVDSDGELSERLKRAGIPVA